MPRVSFCQLHRIGWTRPIEKPMKLDLEPHEVTIILKGLDKLPRKEAEQLIKKIVEQDAEQKLKHRP